MKSEQTRSTTVLTVRMVLLTHSQTVRTTSRTTWITVRMTTSIGVSTERQKGMSLLPEQGSPTLRHHAARRKHPPFCEAAQTLHTPR